MPHARGMVGNAASLTRDSCRKIEAVFSPIVCFQFLRQPSEPRTEQNKSSRRSYRILIGLGPWIRRIKVSPDIPSSRQGGPLSLQTFLAGAGACAQSARGSGQADPGCPPSTIPNGTGHRDEGTSPLLLSSPSPAFLSLPAASPWCSTPRNNPSAWQ